MRTSTRRMPSIAGKEGQWRTHMEAWQQSGMSQRDYCAAKGIALSTFTLWRRRLLAGRKTAHNGPECIDIVAIRDLPVATTPIILELGSGRYRIQLAEGFKQECLRTVLDTLETR